VTEAEWSACNDPDTMLEVVSDTASDRRFRLFVCACCRRLLPLLRGIHKEGYAPCVKAIEEGEQLADKPLGRKEWEKFHATDYLMIAWGMKNEGCRLAVEAAMRACYLRLVGDTRPMRFGRRLIGHPASEGAEFARLAASIFAADRDNGTKQAATAAKGKATRAEKLAQTALLRDLFSNPRRPSRQKTALRRWRVWNDGCVPKLAQGVYEERAFDRLPILADALEDAGCSDEEILAHCRGGGEHARGCWVVDMILGKK
jgi:hypothetical protein